MPPSPSEPTTVRRPVPADGAAIAAAHTRAWRVGYADLMPAPFLAGIDEVERAGAWEQRLIAHERAAAATRSHTFLVAERESSGDVVGIATVGRTRDGDAEPGGGEIWMLNVRPDAWRGGVGTVLLAAAVDMLFSHGYRRLTLWVVDGNHRARTFYEANDWRPDAAVKTEMFGGRPITEVRYRRSGGEDRRPTIAPAERLFQTGGEPDQ